MSNWREIFESRQCTPEQAVAGIKSGDTVNLPILAPNSVLKALWARRDELRDVRLQLNAPTHNPGWFGEDSADSFSIDFEIFIGDFARSTHDEKRGVYLPNLFSTCFKASDEQRPDTRVANVGIVACSPPNDAGYVHFGPHHWTKRSLIRRADLAIAEIDPLMINVHGDVYAHVSEFDHFITSEKKAISQADIDEALTTVKPENLEEITKLIPLIPKERLRLLLPLIGGFEPEALKNQLGLIEPPAAYKAIAENLKPLIDDGDCIQIGIGEPSSLMVKLGVFDERKDLGMHTELIAPGTAGLVEKGILNGKRKNQFKGQVVAAAWSGGTDQDMRFINDNPTFQLFDPEFILDLRLISQNDRQVSINSALSIDLTGQINAESVFGARMINGTGGQPENHIGAFLSKGGKCITLIPSTALDGAISRIVPQLEAGSLVTIPRYYADMIVSEYGVARLLGKNHLDRAKELIAIAHPDFREDLQKAAKELFG
ncbi:MAG: hypothetical protein KUG75_09740 [Pseudomonadales bacterium]|nr:hypothetical protein [Pseudomonadales bacterium]